MKNFRFIHLFVFFSIIMLPRLSYSWGAVAHYSMSRILAQPQGQNTYAIGPQVDPETVCMNLPDVWLNRDAQIITREFSWTHGVLTDGNNTVLSINLGPHTPLYPDDGREPGLDMYTLATKKMKNNQAAINTALGFIGHNGMDRNVHWDYFLGYDVTQAGNWLVQHNWKERWADYLFYLRDAGGYFDDDGKAAMFFGKDVRTSAVLIPCTADATIIKLGQEVYSKNHRFTDTARTMTLDAQSVTDIARMVSEKQAGLTGEVKSMTKDNFDYYTDLAMVMGWSDVEMLAFSRRSLDVSSKRLKKTLGLIP